MLLTLFYEHITTVKNIVRIFHKLIIIQVCGNL